MGDVEAVAGDEIARGEKSGQAIGRMPARLANAPCRPLLG